MTITLTRDSLIWWVGMIGALLTALANNGGLFPVEWKPYIDLAALLVGIISGKLATSPLAGAKKV